MSGTGSKQSKTSKGHIHCPSCKTSNDECNNNCTKCGALLSQQTTATPTTPVPVVDLVPIDIYLYGLEYNESDGTYNLPFEVNYDRPGKRPEVKCHFIGMPGYDQVADVVDGRGKFTGIPVPEKRVKCYVDIQVYSVRRKLVVVKPRPTTFSAKSGFAKNYFGDIKKPKGGDFFLMGFLFTLFFGSWLILRYAHNNSEIINHPAALQWFSGTIFFGIVAIWLASIFKRVGSVTGFFLNRPRINNNYWPWMILALTFCCLISTIMGGFGETWKKDFAMVEDKISKNTFVKAVGDMLDGSWLVEDQTRLRAIKNRTKAQDDLLMRIDDRLAQNKLLTMIPDADRSSLELRYVQLNKKIFLTNLEEKELKEIKKTLYPVRYASWVLWWVTAILFVIFILFLAAYLEEIREMFLYFSEGIGSILESRKQKKIAEQQKDGTKTSTSNIKDSKETEKAISRVIGIDIIFEVINLIISYFSGRKTIHVGK